MALGICYCRFLPGVCVSYERGTPVHGHGPEAGSSRGKHNGLLITEFIKEVSPLLPNPCHFQNYDQSMDNGRSP